MLLNVEKVEIESFILISNLINLILKKGKKDLVFSNSTTTVEPQKDEADRDFIQDGNLKLMTDLYRTKKMNRKPVKNWN